MCSFRFGVRGHGTFFGRVCEVCRLEGVAIAGQVINLSEMRTNLFEEAVKLQLRVARQRILARQILQQGQVERVVGRGQCSAPIDRRYNALREGHRLRQVGGAQLFGLVDRGTRPASLPKGHDPVGLHACPIAILDCAICGMPEGWTEGKQRHSIPGAQPLYCGKSATFHGPGAHRVQL